MTRSSFSWLLALLLPSWLPGAVVAAPLPPEQVEFFEKKIRPVLVEHCHKCHSAEAKKVRGGLRVDTAAALRKGGDTGPAIVPGQPDRSLLLQALRHEGPEMPPNSKLPAAVIADFEKWLALGAPDPRSGAVTTLKGSTIDFAKARKHWAYQPVRRPELPAVLDRSWPATPIDHFVLGKLEHAGLAPSPPADRRTLIRRAYYDLIGLPPTPAEIEAFEKDASPDAFAKVVDYLLASPHYGERWGRYWLDVARYADTKDLVLLFGPDRVRPYAYTYRDYVIRAFNTDTPYDRFIHEQLAADQLDLKGESWRLAAMGFLTLGRLFDNNLHDIYDDQIDTVSRGFLALTVSCARCHDHKYDAIGMADYYSLHGVFAGCESPIDLPVIDDPKKTPGSAEFEKSLHQKRQELERHIDAQYTLQTETARARVADYLVRVATQKPDPLEEAVFFMSLSPDDLRPQMVSRWRRYLDRHAEGDPVFGPWHDLMALPEAGFAAGAQARLAHWQSVPAGTGRGQVNPLMREALAGAPLADRAEVARRYGTLLKRVLDESKGIKPAALSPERRQLLAVLTGPDGPTYIARPMTYLYMSRVERDNYGRMLRELDKLAVTSPGAPPRAMVLTDSPEPYQPRIFVRGNPSVPGESVPRQFLRVLAGDDPQLFTHGSGRLDLARSITDPNNPLTPRVMVNRVWMHHVGEPLVTTPSDFGTRSTPPSHPELLDYLAWTFREGGWSLKKLHRVLMLSRVYQQASFDRPECRKVDPDNRLLWRAHRRRLDFEAMRDTLLAVSGRLDPRLGGRPVDVAGDPLNGRRTVYALVDRQDLPGLFRAFDFAVPDQSVERRPQTTVPQQALFAMNSPFMLEQARALAARPEIPHQTAAAQRVAALYRLVLGRSPEPAEVQLGVRFVQAAQADPALGKEVKLGPWEQYAQVLLLTNELMFVD
jgi:hypothetical protein